MFLRADEGPLERLSRTLHTQVPILVLDQTGPVRAIVTGASLVTLQATWGNPMKVADIMQTPVRTVTSDTPISEVVVSLADAQVSGLPVVDTRGRVVGVVSSTDLIAAQAETRSTQERQNLLDQTAAGDLMTRTPLMIESTAEVQEAARHMLYAEVRRLFVEEEGTLVGVISQTDIVRAVATGELK
jgi:CBS domain-containing protein